MEEDIMSRPAKLFGCLLGALTCLAMAGNPKRPAAPAPCPAEGVIRFTILYDNYVHREGTRADWGFSCLVEGTEKTILFDTGTRPEILAQNAKVLGVDWKTVDLVVISHNHGDHTGGLPAVLEENPEVTVFYPASFPTEFRSRVEGLKARARAVREPLEICRNVRLTGEIGSEIIEQSLIVDTAEGMVVVTGCSHPGIVKILERAGGILDRPIHLVFGGFHLGAATEGQIERILARFKALGVGKCGATHCTGDKAIAAFKAAFGSDFIPMGTGRVIEIPAL
jgi:7,8-dihydropterin-6-yl-methyl-4-(beta-D-ribofuranosyl)aminobenzene 5'-phosphate synthase